MATSVNLGYALWLDGETFNAQIGRTFDVAATTMSNGTAMAAAVRSGVLPIAGAEPLLVAAATGMNITINPGYCIVANSSGPLQGAYRFGQYAQATLTVDTADATNPRIDLVVAQVVDNGDATSFCEIALVDGTAAPVPSPPATPSNAIVLAQILVPAGATSVGTITDERVFTCMPGGTLRVANATERAALTPIQGMKIFRRDTGLEEMWSGSAWIVQPQVLADSGWISFPAASGFSAFSSTIPGYRLMQIGPQPVVQLRGALQKASSFSLSGGVIVGTLPVGYRPPTKTFFGVATQFTTESAARAQVDTNGDVTLQGPQSVQWISLDGISFSTSLTA